ILATFYFIYINIHITYASLWPSFSNGTQLQKLNRCSGGQGLKYLSGDALTDSNDCFGPNNAPYPSAAVARTFSNWNGNARRGRQSKFPNTLDPSVTKSALLRAYDEANNEVISSYRVGTSSECDVVRGECTQTYVPYLFLVIPLGPVTLTGQDYVLVESGCVCKPKYSTGAAQEPNMIPV
uniref:Uncharacterized protein n=1 Tax=Glossina brevipalpis TaxID=37001 RepID=A0A1A9WG90_9MUSC